MDRNDIVRELIDQGYNYREIGEHLGVTRQRVFGICKKLGLKTRRHTAESRLRDQQRVITYAINNLTTLRQAARAVGVKTPVAWDSESRLQYRIAKFISRIVISEDHWIYQGKLVNGYARASVFGKTQWAHRVVFRLINNREPQRLRKTCNRDGCIRHFEEC